MTTDREFIDDYLIIRVSPRLSELALTEIRTMKPKKYAIEKRSIPPASIQPSTDLRQ
jgi:hypothetical protein